MCRVLQTLSWLLSWVGSSWKSCAAQGDVGSCTSASDLAQVEKVGCGGIEPPTFIVARGDQPLVFPDARPPLGSQRTL